jgi:predicted secreted protein
VAEGIIHHSEPKPAQITLTCDLPALEKILAGELEFFVALWATGEIAFEGSFADAFRLGYIFLNDRRRKRVVFLAHCFLNCNPRFPGGCAHDGATVPLIQTLLECGVGIVQMPCPEFLCLGLEKRLYGELEEFELRRCFRNLAAGVIDQMEEYLANGHRVLGIIGMNPSPSCGVEVTKGKGTMLGIDAGTSEREGPGVFMEEMQKIAKARGLDTLPYFGVRRVLPGESGMESRLEEVRQRLIES